MDGVIVFIVIAIIICSIGIVYDQLIRSNKERKNRIAETGANEKCDGSLIDGLPLAQGTTCELLIFDKKIKILGGGRSFEIMINNIINAQIKSSTDIQYIAKNKSSISKTVAGGLLFGPIGAIVGSAPKSKKEKIETNTYYLIINYIDKSKKHSFLVFDVTSDLNRLSIIQLLNNSCKDNKQTETEYL